MGPRIERQRLIINAPQLEHMVYYLGENVSQLKTLSITFVPIECRDL